MFIMHLTDSYLIGACCLASCPENGRIKNLQRNIIVKKKDDGENDKQNGCLLSWRFRCDLYAIIPIGKIVPVHWGLGKQNEAVSGVQSICDAAEGEVLENTSGWNCFCWLYVAGGAEQGVGHDEEDNNLASLVEGWTF